MGFSIFRIKWDKRCSKIYWTHKSAQENKKVSKHLETGKAGSPLYIALCFVLALFGGILGIYAGYIYSKSKVKDVDDVNFMHTMTRQESLES